MKFLIDINHPAHVHFFRHPIQILRERGHEILVTSRIKEMAVHLLDELGIRHQILSCQNGGGILRLGWELLQRDVALTHLARRERPDAMAAIGGTFVAHAGFLTHIPSLVFYDTENARLQNAITYPLASSLIVPRCYQGKLPRNAQRYAGYHELSYLHPYRFTPSMDIAVQNGFDNQQDNFFLRTVSWQANHDIGDTGWSESLLSHLTEHLSAKGKVHISSERPLPAHLARYAYCGQVGAVHHLMAHCRLYLGESATMASECAVLGVPAIYAAKSSRGYTNEQEKNYGLVINEHSLDFGRLLEQVDKVLQQPRNIWLARRQQLLAETIDVAAFVADTIEASRQRKA